MILIIKVKHYDYRPKAQCRLCLKSGYKLSANSTHLDTPATCQRLAPRKIYEHCFPHLDHGYM